MLVISKNNLEYFVAMYVSFFNVFILKPYFARDYISIHIYQLSVRGQSVSRHLLLERLTARFKTPSRFFPSKCTFRSLIPEN